MKTTIRLIVAVLGVILLGLAIIRNAQQESANDFRELQHLTSISTVGSNPAP